MTNIIASYWSVAGNRYPGCGDESSPYGFAERYELAGKLGYAGAGFVHDDLVKARETIGFRELDRILSSNGIEDIEVEILTDWFASGERRQTSDAMRRDLLEAAGVIGARHLKISGDFHGGTWTLEQMAEPFAALCADAANVGLAVGIEVLPFTNLATIDFSRKVVEAAGAPNGGLLLDIWHMERNHIDFDEIGRLPKEMIISVEIDDAAAEIEGNIWKDTVDSRLPCGQGSFRIREFLEQVARTGYDGPVGIEIISKEHRVLPLEVAARRAIDSARPYLSAAFN